MGRNATTVSVPRSTPARIAGIDGMRALAIAAVVCLHLNWSGLIGGGQAGVTVFFVVSGYLITAALLREHEQSGAISLRVFYAKRFWRLAPPFLIAVGLGMIASFALWQNPSFERVAGPLEYVPSALLAVTQTLNIAVANGHTVSYELMPTWSLGVEEQFYVMWALALVASLKFAGKRTAAVVAIGGAFASLSWSWVLAADGATKERVAYAPDTQLGPLLIGASLAIALSHPRINEYVSWSRLRVVAGWVAAAALVACLINHPFDLPLYTWGQGALALATAICVALLATANPHRPSLGARVLSLTPLVWIGTLSYGIYLFHVLVMQWFGGPGSIGRGITILAIATLGAFASYRWVEQPLIRWSSNRQRLKADGAREVGVEGAKGAEPATWNYLAKSPLMSRNESIVVARSSTSVSAST